MKSATASLAPQRRENPDTGRARRTYDNFRTLDHALLDANLDAARRAFARLQQDSPALAEVVQATPQLPESPRRSWLRLLAKALESGAVDRAQHAFLQLQSVATIDTRDPFSRSTPPVSPRSFWSAIDSEG